jgi:hypothetical protein
MTRPRLIWWVLSWVNLLLFCGIEGFYIFTHSLLHILWPFEMVVVALQAFGIFCRIRGRVK